MITNNNIDYKTLASIASLIDGVSWEIDSFSQEVLKLEGDFQSLGLESKSKKEDRTKIKDFILGNSSIQSKLKSLKPGTHIIIQSNNQKEEPLITLLHMGDVPELGVLKGFTFLRDRENLEKPLLNQALSKVLILMEDENQDRWSLLKSIQKTLFESYDGLKSDIWIVDPRDKLLKKEDAYSLRKLSVKDIHSRQIDLKKNQDIAGKAWKQMKPLVEHNISGRKRLPRYEEYSTLNVESILVLPLVCSNNLIAFIEIMSDQENAFDSASPADFIELKQLFESLISIIPETSAEYFVPQELKEVFDAIPIMIWMKDSKGKIVTVNKEAEKRMQLPFDLICGRNTIDVHKSEGSLYRRDDWQILESGKPKIGLVNMFDKGDGKRFWMKIDKHPIVGKGNKPQGIVVFCTEITEAGEDKTQSEKIQQEFKDLYFSRVHDFKDTSVFFELSKELMCIANSKGYFTQLNSAWTNLLGYSEEELLSSPWNDFVHPEDREKTDEIAYELTEKGRVRGFENRYISKSGKVYWFKWYGAAYDDVIYATAYDITEQKRAKSELEDLHNLFQQMATHVPGVIYQFLYKKDGTMSFPYVSDGALKMFGHTPQAIEEDVNLVFDALHPDDLPEVIKAIKQSVDTFSQFMCEARVLSPGNRITHLKARSSPEKLENGDILYNGLMVDITDLKETQEENEQLTKDLANRLTSLKVANYELERMTEKLEQSYGEAIEASKLKSEFVANISHEIRTPISAIIGLGELMLDTQLDSEQYEYSNNILKSANTLLDLINQILDFSKIEAMKLTVESIEYNLFSLVEGSVSLFSHEAGTKGLRVSIWIDPRLPKTVVGDPVRCRQILLNLLSNAIKFTNEGEIFVKVYSEEKDDGKTYLVFEVDDQGVGIPADYRPKMFSPFLQADGTTTREFGGTGLGLSICKRLSELLGGDVEHVAKDRGSIFRFFYPCDLTLIPKYEGKESDNFAILFQGTSSENKIIQSYLEHQGVDFETSTKYGDLIYKLDHKLDKNATVIISLTEGKTENISVIEKLRHGSRYEEVDIVVICDYQNRSLATKAIEVGADNFLVVPVYYEKVIGQVTGKSSSVETPEIKRTDKSPSQLLNPTILVVEDNRMIREVTKRQLENLNVNVVISKNGEEALELVKNQSVDLILMDCQMPVMDGYETTLQIRKVESKSDTHTPIIALTAFALKGDHEKCMQAGMDDYVKKPVRMQELHEVIIKWLPEFQSTLSSAGSVVSQSEEDMDTSREGSQSSINLNLIKQHYGNEITEILVSFTGEVNQFLTNLEVEFENENWNEIGKIVHQLKGLVSLLCLESLEKLLGKFESNCKEGNRAEAEQVLIMLKNQINSVSKDIDYILNSK